MEIYLWICQRSRDDPPHKSAHVVEVQQHSDEIVRILYRIFISSRRSSLAVLSEVLYQPKYDARHHGLGYAHQVGGRLSFAAALVRTVLVTKSGKNNFPSMCYPLIYEYFCKKES